MFPIQFLFGVSDHLLAARYATGFIWATGLAMLSLIVYKQSGSFLLGTTFGLLGSSLAIFGQASSFVSPHASVPILVAVALRLVFFVEAETKLLLYERFQKDRRVGILTKRYLFLLIIICVYGLMVGFTVPHAAPILVVMWVYVFVGLIHEHARGFASFISLLILTSVSFLSAGASLVLVTRFWSWQHSARAVAWPKDVDPSVGDELGNVTYGSLPEQILSLWLHFWPSGLSNLDTQGAIPVFLESIWSYLLPALLISAVATLGVFNWISRITLGLVIASPIASNLAFSVLNFVSPNRYGLALFLLGLFGLANQKTTSFFRVSLFVAATITYIVGFLYSPIPFTEAVCPPGSFSWTLGCLVN
jgi:hypothetical protein